jgi:hypothetical protein
MWRVQNVPQAKNADNRRQRMRDRQRSLWGVTPWIAIFD